MVRYLDEKQAIYFMDKQNVDKTKNMLKLKNLHERYLPITTGNVNKCYTVQYPNDDSLKCVWIGRLDDFKISILLHTIKRLDQIDSLSLSLDIIGDGRYSQRVITECRICKRLKTRMLGSVTNDDLDIILSQYHLLFAMGTSALEGAKLNLPTICVDFSYDNIKGLYKYEMLYERMEYDVGKEISNDKYEKTSSLENLLLKIKDNYRNEALMTFKYWEKYYNPSILINRFITAVKQSDCRIQDLIDRKYHKADIFTLLTVKILKIKSKESGFILR